MRYIALTLFFLVPSALWANMNPAERHMQGLGNQVISILNSSSGDKQMKREFEALLVKNFALPAMGKFVLGKYWRVASQQEKTDFLKLFRKSVVTTYSNRFETNTAAKFKVTGSRQSKDGSIVVNSQLIRASGKPMRIDWRIRGQAGSYKIYDVLIEGVSMSITQRSEYAAVIQREGGKVGGLNKAIQPTAT